MFQSGEHQFWWQVLSSVLYLSSTGGPTVVLEQSATDTLADQAFLCNPKENVLFCFPGKYLHGVLPGQLRFCNLLMKSS